MTETTSKPKRKNRSTFPCIHIGIDPVIWNQVKDIAKELGIPYNQAVTCALKDYIDSQTFN